MNANHFDLLIRCSRIICPAGDLDYPGAVGIRGDRIVAVGREVSGSAQQEIDCSDSLLLPGLIDLHAHPARSGSVFGIEPDEHMLQRGTTTVLSQGDAGADNCDNYVRETIEGSATRVLMALNLSFVGESTTAGCYEQLEWVDVDACTAAVERCRDHVWGIAVNASHHCCGSTDPHEVVRRALTAAERTGLPILYGMRNPEDWPLDEQLTQLRPGDVVTYCFRREPHCIVANGRVHPAVWQARHRGVLFDVGHGCGSFDFNVAETALQDGFAPDTISTDLQARHQGQTPIHDLPLVMSKLRAAGMTEGDILAAVTSKPADILSLPDEIGSLAVGSCADLTVLRWNDTDEDLVDVNGHRRSGGRWQPKLTVRAGQPVLDDGTR